MIQPVVQGLETHWHSRQFVTLSYPNFYELQLNTHLFACKVFWESIPAISTYSVVKQEFPWVAEYSCFFTAQITNRSWLRCHINFDTKSCHRLAYHDIWNEYENWNTCGFFFSKTTLPTKFGLRSCKPQTISNIKLYDLVWRLKVFRTLTWEGIFSISWW